MSRSDPPASPPLRPSCQLYRRMTDQIWTLKELLCRSSSPSDRPSICQSVTQSGRCNGGRRLRLSRTIAIATALPRSLSSPPPRSLARGRKTSKSLSLSSSSSPPPPPPTTVSEPESERESRNDGWIVDGRRSFSSCSAKLPLPPFPSPLAARDHQEYKAFRHDWHNKPLS